MGHIHVCSAGIGPCDDPEDHLVVSIGSEGLFYQVMIRLSIHWVCVDMRLKVL